MKRLRLTFCTFIILAVIVLSLSVMFGVVVADEEHNCVYVWTYDENGEDTQTTVRITEIEGDYSELRDTDDDPSHNCDPVADDNGVGFEIPNSGEYLIYVFKNSDELWGIYETDVSTDEVILNLDRGGIIPVDADIESGSESIVAGESAEVSVDLIQGEDQADNPVSTEGTVELYVYPEGDSRPDTPTSVIDAGSVSDVTNEQVIDDITLPDSAGKYTVEALVDTTYDHHSLSSEFTHFSGKTDIGTIDVIEAQYTLSVSSDTGGKVDIDSAGSNSDWTEAYEEGTEIELTADPDSGYEFDGWSGDVSSFNADDETISVTMDEDKTISASFEEESIEPSISPTFEYSPDQPTEDNDIVFDADDSVINNGTIDSYQWDFTGDGEYDKTGSVVVESFEPGTHTVDLIVTADDGTTETTTEVVEVESAQIDADIQISPSNPREGEDVTIDASDSAVSDEGDEIVEYKWDLNNNEEDKTGSIAVTSFESGTHTIGVTLQTESGLEKHSEKTVEVDPELANIQITATDTTFSVDQSTLIEYSVTNFISSEELTVQMLLEKPNDVAVTDIQNARGTNQFTAVGTVPPGEQETILIEVEPNTAEEIEINAIAEYHISGDEENSERKTESLKFDIEDEQSISEDDTSTSDDETDDEAPGFGFSSVIFAVIGIGFLIRRSNL